MDDTKEKEIEEELPDETVEVEEETDTENDDTEDSDIDFDYDENGDIIIPEESEDSESDDGEEDDETEEEAQEETEEEETEESETEEVLEPAQHQSDERDKENAELRRRLSLLESQTKDTLAKLGVDETDVMAGLEKLAAEADEITPEEYRRRKAEENRKAEAVRIMQATEFEKKMQSDLAEVHAAFPETRSFDSVTKFPNFAKFGQFRDKGLTPKEAYIAANPDAVRASVATATKRQSLNDTKNHLRPAVGKTTKDTSISMSKKELAEYRDLFPNMSDKDIISLYAQTKKK